MTSKPENGDEKPLPRPLSEPSQFDPRPTREETAFLEMACGGCLYHNSMEPMDLTAQGTCRRFPATPVMAVIHVKNPQVIGQMMNEFVMQNRQAAHANVWPACAFFKFFPDPERVRLYHQPWKKAAN